MSEAKLLMREVVTLTADELVELREIAVNANKPVIEALGQVLSEIQALREDLNAAQRSNNEQLKTLRKAVFGDGISAE